MQELVVGIAAFAGAMLSALAGIGGGILLLGVLAQFFPPVLAIPIQGSIQLVANGSRAAFLATEISWDVVWRTSILILPASFLGVAVATSIPTDATRLMLGLFVLVAAWRPIRRPADAGREVSAATLVGVGAMSGLLNTTVGASGPATAPFLKAATVSHAAFVATSAATQVGAHGAKILAFGLDGFSLTANASTIAVGTIAVIVGSRLGTRLVGRISERTLTNLFRLVLTTLGLRLVIRALL